MVATLYSSVRLTTGPNFFHTNVFSTFPDSRGKPRLKDFVVLISHLSTNPEPAFRLKTIYKHFSEQPRRKNPYALLKKIMSNETDSYFLKQERRFELSKRDFNINYKLTFNNVELSERQISRHRNTQSTYERFIRKQQ